MVKLSDRLQRLADEVQAGETVADIGTDHGLLPIFLYENHKAAKVILCDINEGPLLKAKQNIEAYGAFGLTDLRLGDGLGPLEPAEADTVIIAGMGGLLMAEILGADLPKSKSFAKLVLQPRNAPERLRRWLCGNGWQIRNESLVREGRYICEIITAAPCAEEQTETGQEAAGGLDYEISPLLFRKRDTLLIPFIEKKIRTEHEIIKNIEAGSGKADHGRIRLAEERLEALNGLLRKARETV